MIAMASAELVRTKASSRLAGMSRSVTGSVATAVAERGAFLNRASSPSSPPLPSTLRTVSLPPRFFLTSTLPSCTRKASLLASSPSLKMTSPALNVRLGTSPLGRLMRFPLDIEWLAVHL